MHTVGRALQRPSFAMGKLDKAEADSKRAHELRPDDFLSSIFLSEIYVMQGRPQDALPEIESVGITTFVCFCIRSRTTRLVGKRTRMPH